MGDLQGYIMPEELAAVLKPVPAAMVRLITLKQLQVRGYWLRPVIEPGETGPCPCCGEVQAEASFGICADCYEPAVRGAMFGAPLLDHLAWRSEIEKGKDETMEAPANSGEKQHTMSPALAAVLRPMSRAEAETATIVSLVKFWRRPLIKHNAKSACPCCGGVHQLRSSGICSGCYSAKVIKNDLTGLALLDHMALRAGGVSQRTGRKRTKESTVAPSAYMLPGQIVSEFITAKCTLSPLRSVLASTLYWTFCLWLKDNLDKGPLPSQKYFNQIMMGGGNRGESWIIKKERRDGRYHYTGISLKDVLEESIRPASESSSPAAAPLAGAGLMESTSFEMVFRIAIGLEKDSPVQELPQHLETLMRERDRFRNELEDLKESISPASESLSPAATPPAGAGQVECKEQQVAGLEGVAAAVAIRIALGLDSKTSLRDLPPLIAKLVADHDYLSEEMNKVVELLSPADDEDLDQTVRRMASEASAVIQERDNLAEKLVELTQEVASLNRVLAREPSRGLDKEQRETCESILGILGIGNGFALSGHDSQEDMEAITAGLIRGAIADGVWRADAIAAKELTEQDVVAKWSALPVPDGYESLAAVLQEALDQAAHGKGLERHADDRPFHDQPIMRETQAVGLGFPAGQARKKILEAVHCCNDHPERAVADLLGAINYTAATVIAIRAMMVEQAA